ncbi:YihY/virulence factor BrkB family protein [Falsiroseomonas oryziterrae]|uniref:YihY/virulence factor BrkB family protein n=1 Tax=Falsiroseomonas oryziterrae TaxID=2911368 RepID=UPI001F3857CD|nr:YihY/virulence factor BrkB family protein [Roseomonas sp. NPKOSM-4]
MAEADDKAAEDWRSEHERAEEEPLLVARARARERGRGREATAPGDIPARGWRDIFWRVLRNVSEDRVLYTAGSVAFFALLSIFPALATVVSVYGFFADAGSIRTHLALLEGLVPDGVLLLIGDELARVATQRSDTLGIAFVVGLGIAFWSANGGVAALFDALNVVYKEREKRSLLRFYGTTFLFTLGGVAFVLLALGLVVVLPVALGLFGAATQAERLVGFARWPVMLLAVMLGLALVYRFGPSRRVARWRWVTWGSATAALLWVGVSMLFSWYVASFDSYNRVYGSLGAGIGFVTWIWISAVVVLLGGELNAEMEHQTAHDTTKGRPKPLGRRGAVVADTVGEAQD